MNDAEMMERHDERKEMSEAEKPAPLPAVTATGHAGLPRVMFSGRERERVCAHCARTFTQYELSPAMNAWVASLSVGAQRHWKATITENALPLFCIKCERRDIGIVTVAFPSQSAA